MRLLSLEFIVWVMFKILVCLPFFFHLLSRAGDAYFSLVMSFSMEAGERLVDLAHWANLLRPVVFPLVSFGIDTVVTSGLISVFILRCYLISVVVL